MLRFRYIVLILLAIVLLVNVIVFFLWKCTHIKVLEIYFKRILPFFVPVFTLLGIIFFSSAILAKKELGVTAEEQIKQQFNDVRGKKYDVIILGNSRLYRGINPKLLNYNCYNFSFDNDSFLECFYKLKYLEKNDRLPNKILLGVDYFEFSFVSVSNKSIYDLFFDNEYDEVLANGNYLSLEKSRNLDKRINRQFNTFCIFNYYNAISYIYNKYFLGDKNISYVSELGQYRIYPQPKASRGDFLTRSSVIISEQKKSYNDIIKLCDEKNIKLVLIMLPLREIELNCYKEDTIKKFDIIFNSVPTVDYLNFSSIENFTLKDFMDDTHLNLDGADKFTSILNIKLQDINF